MFTCVCVMCRDILCVQRAVEQRERAVNIAKKVDVCVSCVVIFLAAREPWSSESKQ